MTVPRFYRVNRKYDVGEDHEVLYIHLVVPKDRAGEIRGKLNMIIDWFISRNKIRSLNKSEHSKYQVEVKQAVTDNKELDGFPDES